MNSKGMTLLQSVLFVLIVGILVILVLMATQPKVHAADFNADLAGFQKERGEIINRINQYQQVIENNKYRLAQVDALIQYTQVQVAELEKPKEEEKKVKRYKVEIGEGSNDKITVPLKEEEISADKIIKELTTLSGTASEKEKK